jgi:hypothetical protein
MAVYDLYKPLRNHLRQLSLIDALEVVRAYLQNLQFRQPMPAGIEVDASYSMAPYPHKRVYEWEFDILAKEIILQAPMIGRQTLRKWSSLSGIVDKLKALEDGIALEYEKLYSENILLEVYRIAHRQFPWQQRRYAAVLTRYFKIFGHPRVEPLVRRHVGLSSQELYMLGIATTGFFLNRFAIEQEARFDVPGLTREQFDLFVSHFGTDIDDLRNHIRGAQSYDQDFAYAFNPLIQSPLVRCSHNGKRLIVAPVPTYLFRRFTEGVYYEICNDAEFAAAFGASFQQYVGEVANAANVGGTFTIVPESPYMVGKDRKDSVDWIVSDPTATLFLECKTKKLRYGAKFKLADTELLDEDLDKMAGFIVQIYKTLNDALEGRYSHWRPLAHPIYPVIVTLEEWYVFGHQIVPAVEERVKKRLAANGLDISLLTKYPYTVCSVADFERAAQVMDRVTIRAFMEPRFAGERRRWNLDAHMFNSFSEHLTKIAGDLFPNDTARIHPSFAARRKPR